MLKLITKLEVDEFLGIPYWVTIVAIDENDNEVFVPQVHPSALNATFNEETEEWTIV